MSVVVGLLLLLSPLLSKRYRARWRYWAWLLVALRLLIPWNLSLPDAPVSIEVPDMSRPPLVIVPPAATAPPAVTALPGSQLQPAPPAAPAPARPAITLRQGLALLYGAGAILFLSYYFIGALRLARYCRRWCSPCTDPEIHTALALAQRRLGLSRCPPVFTCPGLAGPMLSGLLSPKLLLPEDGLAPDAMVSVFLHELSHYRRRDLWYKLLLLLANALHWFNPLIWLMRAAADRDLEQSCDELVLRVLSPEERDLYAHAILSAISINK